MERTFYEVVLEGHFGTILGFFEGFILGRKKKYQYWFCDKIGIRTETFSEVISEWITFKHKIHHMILEESLYNEFKAALEKMSDNKTINLKFVKSMKKIKSASFNFEYSTYGRKYADRFKKLIKNHPPGLKIKNYTEDEDYSDVGEDHVLDAYPSDHEYEFYAKGTVTGELGDLIDFREKVISDPLAIAKRIRIVV